MELLWAQQLKSQGRAEGLAWAVMALLQKRGLQLTEEQRQIFSSCQDISLLQSCLLKAPEVNDVSELFPAGWKAPERPVEEVLSERARTLEDKLDEAYEQLSVLLGRKAQSPNDPTLQQAVQNGFEQIEGLKQELLEVIQTAREKKLLMPLNAGQELAEYAQKLLRGEDATPPSYFASEDSPQEKA